MKLLSKAFNFVIITSKKYNIDESHGLSHSLNVLHYAHKIYRSELKKDDNIKQYKKIIYLSSIIHDMCDKKYMNEQEGIKNIEKYFKNDLSKDEFNVIKNIISTMSYSTVKKNGFSNLNEYNLSYHIVREADLLTGYDFERCMIYKMNLDNSNLKDSCLDAIKLFDKRTLKQIDDGLFITEYGNKKAIKLHKKSLSKINYWKNILDL